MVLEPVIVSAILVTMDRPFYNLGKISYLRVIIRLVYIKKIWSHSNYFGKLFISNYDSFT